MPMIRDILLSLLAIFIVSGCSQKEIPLDCGISLFEYCLKTDEPIDVEIKQTNFSEFVRFEIMEDNEVHSTIFVGTFSFDPELAEIFCTEQNLERARKERSLNVYAYYYDADSCFGSFLLTSKLGQKSDVKIVPRF